MLFMRSTPLETPCWVIRCSPLQEQRALVGGRVDRAFIMSASAWATLRTERGASFMTRSPSVTDQLPGSLLAYIPPSGGALTSPPTMAKWEIGSHTKDIGWPLAP